MYYTTCRIKCHVWCGYNSEYIVYFKNNIGERMRSSYGISELKQLFDVCIGFRLLKISLRLSYFPVCAWETVKTKIYKSNNMYNLIYNIMLGTKYTLGVEYYN